MKHFVVYGKSGQILRTGFCSEADVRLQPEGDGEGVLALEEMCRYEDHYVAGGEIRLRPTLALQLDKPVVAPNEIATISGVPRGCEVVFDGESHAINDGVLEWSSAVVGSYELLFSFFPFREEIIAIEVAE